MDESQVLLDDREERDLLVGQIKYLKLIPKLASATKNPSELCTFYHGRLDVFAVDEIPVLGHVAGRVH